MRHMRSRRILAMLLALSMIFGLLTTTAFAGEVDQNTSNVGESAANGTSEVGSGVGQSSGASEDESSKVTNKEDVPTEEETNPEEKKTTSSEEVDTQVGEGMEVPTATTIATDEALINAINNAVDGDTITLAEGQYQISDLIGLSNANKAVTISAETNATVILNAADGIALHGAKITFNGITFQWGTANYKGIQHASELEYNDCIINGKVFLYAGKETFNHCTFNQDSADYCVWTYGAAETTFNDCTFNCKGKAVLVYNEGYIKTVKVEVNNTTFAASETVDKKAAIELDTHLMKGASITVDNASTATGFSTNTTDGAGLWNAKRIDSENNETVEVVVGGEVKYTLTTAPVAMVNGVSYDKLEDAFAALSDKAYTLTLNDESAWDTATPVYWAAGTQSGYEATLAEALTAAYKANVGDITIICRPGADVGTMTHGHVADNITIYGNKAYISAGECDLEVDTFQFSRETGKQATDGVTLDKDITITAYELDNLGVWGQRNTNNTVNVNLTDCDTVQGITVQRVYISGTTGVNNITLSGCDFGTKATSVYSNADGDINIANCSFTDAQVPVNFNHKAGGAQTVTVSNCTFTRCGDDGVWKQFAAPVRFVNSGSGTQSATADTCTFAGTVGVNGDILIGDGRTGQKSNDVSLTVTNTEANIQAQQPGYYKDDGTTDNALKGEKALTAGETLTVSKMEDLIGGSAGIKGSSAENAYTLAELGAMTRAEYIAAQDALGGTMYVSVGDYSYDKDGVLGNGKRDDTTGQTEDRNVLNGYNSNGYLGTNNDGANGKNIVFVGSSITSGVTGYTSIDNIGTSLLLAVPAYTNVTFKGITFNNVMCFNYQLYTSPWSQLGELKFDNCTFNGIIVGATAAQTLTFNGCTFTNFTNTTDANSSNPTWIRPAYGNWTPSDNKGQGEDFRSLTKINFTNNKVTSTRPVKFEYISQWDVTSTITVDGNTFNISAQEGDTKVKNVGMYFGSHTNENAFNLILGTNEKIGTTAALYTLNENQTSLPVGSTVKDLSGNEITVTDALEWKTENPITLKTEPVPAVKNVAKVGETEYATLEEAIAKAEAGQTVTLIADVNTPERTYVVSKNLTIDLNGKTVTGSGYDGVFQIDGADAKVLIKNGNVVAVEQSGSAGKYAMAVWACAENCELTLEGLTVTQDIAHTDDKQMDMIYTSKGTIIINSGSFTSGTPAWTLNCKDAAFKDGSAKIIVNGGTFTGFDPCNNAAEGKGTSFVAEGVGVDYDENGSFTAKAGMAAQVLDADGNSVKAYDSLAEAIAAAEAGQTVRLLTNATENVTIADNKNLTLDLNGHTINGGTGTAVATIKNCGTVTITDSSAAKTGTIKRDDQGVKDEKSYYVIRNIGTMTIEQAIVTNNSGYAKPNPSGSMVGSSLICNGDDDLGGTLNISGGTFEQQNFLVIKNGALGTLNVTGGTFTSKHSAIQNWFKANITGGEIKGQLWTDSWKVDESVGETTIGGNATFTGEIVMDIYGNVPPTLEITGGKLDVTNWRVTPAAAKAGAKPAVSGGTFSSAIPYEYCAEGYIPVKNGENSYGVKKGTYVAEVNGKQYETLAAAFAAAKDGDTITLLSNCTGDGIKVNQDAFPNGLTVDFGGYSYTIGGVLVGSSGTASNGFQLLKGNKLTFKNGSIYGDASVAGDTTTIWQGAPAIMIQNYSNLTLDGMTVVGGKETCYTISNNCGDTLIKNSTITAGEASTKPAYRPARAFDVCGYSTYTGVSVSVENSTINGNIEISKSNGNTYDATLTLGSGTKVNGSISDGGNGDKVTVTKDTSVNVAAPDGYKWVDGENGQTLAKIVMVAEVNGTGYETLAEAFAAATDNSTIKLLTDITIEGSKGLEVKAGNGKKNVAPNVTFDLNGHKIDGSNVSQSTTLPAALTILAGYDSNWLGSVTITSSVEGAAIIGQLPLQINASGYADAIRVVVEPSVSLTVLDGGTNAILLNNSPIYLVASDTSKAFYKNGGFMATVGEESRIYETLGGAKTFNKEVKLLNDYKTSNLKVWSSWGAVTLDLDGHICEFTEKANMIELQEGANITFKNGTLKGSGASVIGMPNNNSTLTLDSVAVENAGNFGIATNGTTTNQTVTINNSTIKVPNGMGVYFPSTGKLTINGGSIEANTGIQICAGSLEITGNPTIKATATAAEAISSGSILDGAAVSIVGGRSGYGAMGQVTIDSGSFTSASGIEAVQAYTVNSNNQKADWTDAEAKVNISGGSYSTPVAENLCAEGFVPVTNGDGTYGVQPDGNVAEIGSMKYKSLDEALKAAKDGETVKLLKDAELEEVVIRSGRTLDLNGHTLKADYVTYFGGNLVDNSAAHTGLLKVLSADEILFTKNKKIDAMTQIPIYSLEKQGYVFEEIVLRVAPVTNKTPGALQAVYRPRQKDGTSDLSDAQKAMFGSANGHPVTATFRLVYKYKNSNEVQTFEFDFVDTYMDIYLNQNLYMYVTVTGLDIANIETITVTPVLKSAGGQVELVGKTIDTAAVLANLIGQ